MRTAVKNRKTSWSQFKSFFFIGFLNIVKSPVFKIILVLGSAFLLINLFSGNRLWGHRAYPVTYLVIGVINYFSSILLVILLVFYSGELVWRDKDQHLDEIIDTTPYTAFVSVLAKMVSLVSIISILHLVFICIGISYQLWNGFSRVEIDQYLTNFLLEPFPNYIIYAAIAMLCQVLLNHKYLGYLVSLLLFFGWERLLSIMDVSTHLLAIARGPSLQYSDLNSFGPGLEGALWFKWYWLLFAFICVLITSALWNRGIKKSLLLRIKITPKVLSKNNFILFLGSTLLWVLVGAFIFYNTEIINTNRSRKQEQEISASYETRYKKYAEKPLPKITNISYDIAIFPNERKVTAKTKLTLTNEEQESIDILYFTMNPGWESELYIPNAQSLVKDDTHFFRSYRLMEPLPPNASLEITLKASYGTQGFENERGNTRVVKNGTMIQNRNFLPYLGYNPRFEIQDNAARKEYGLVEKDGLPPLTKERSKYHMEHPIGSGTSNFIPAKTIISTAADQVAIAPGSLVKQWQENNRNYYQYVLDTPSINYHTFNSARYEKAHRKWNGIDLEVYFDKKHPQNIAKILDAMERSLTYYTKNFGPYYHKQCRIIEVPRYVSFGGQAFPGTMLYNESAGFILNIEEDTKVNPVDAVIAHELAHQWWAHQLIGANMQGHAMLSEGLAEYSTLMVLKNQLRDPIALRRFLDYDHQRYLTGRSNNNGIEPSLHKVENQRHIQYGKSSLIFYALQEYIGEEKINMALSDFLNRYKYKEPPYPSTLDFLDHLNAMVPDSLSSFVEESFKKNIIYDIGIKQAAYKKQGDTYQIDIEIESHKIASDSMGNEVEAGMDDWVELGFFLDEDERELYYTKKIKLNKEFTSLSIALDSVPAKVAIDPRHLLIDRYYDDNILPLQTRVSR
ncbi:M1 family aminopeptidase [Spongiimicrobium salis]|uniref:M1 family aminopeptidase n=1 Tax=Spongiimicrobium salis TaxID=1667022 RepID=UPI00374DC8E5